MPIYETAADRQREQRAAALVSEVTGWHLFGTGTPDSFDFFAVDRDRYLRAVIEVKCRTNRHDKYPTYMIDAEKVERLRQIADLYGVPGLVVVSFTNGTAYFNVEAVADIEPTRGGRYDRGDANDIDDVLQIPIDLLRNVRGMVGA